MMGRSSPLQINFIGLPTIAGLTIGLRCKMNTYQTEGMSCQNCVKRITGEIKKIDSNAKVIVDLEKQTIAVESEVDSKNISAAIESAGYPIILG